MTTRAEQLEKLVPLLEAAFHAKQAEFSKVLARIAKLQAQSFALDHPQHAEHGSPAMRAGANLRWDTWVEDRKKMINRELIQAAREREALRGQVAKALAKAEAAQSVFERTKSENRKANERRANW